MSDCKIRSVSFSGTPTAKVAVVNISFHGKAPAAGTGMTWDCVIQDESHSHLAVKAGQSGNIRELLRKRGVDKGDEMVVLRIGPYEPDLLEEGRLVRLRFKVTLTETNESGSDNSDWYCPGNCT